MIPRTLFFIAPCQLRAARCCCRDFGTWHMLCTWLTVAPWLARCRVCWCMWAQASRCARSTSIARALPQRGQWREANLTSISGTRWFATLICFDQFSALRTGAPRTV